MFGGDPDFIVLSGSASGLSVEKFGVDVLTHDLYRGFCWWPFSFHGCYHSQWSSIPARWVIFETYKCNKKLMDGLVKKVSRMLIPLSRALFLSMVPWIFLMTLLMLTGFRPRWPWKEKLMWIFFVPIPLLKLYCSAKAKPWHPTCWFLASVIVLWTFLNPNDSSLLMMKVCIYMRRMGF